MTDVIAAAEAAAAPVVAKVESVASEVEVAAKADLVALEARVKALETSVVTKATTLWGKVKAWFQSHYVALGAIAATSPGMSVLGAAWSMIVKHLF